MGFTCATKLLLLALFTFLIASASSHSPKSHRRLLLQQTDMVSEDDDQALVLPANKKSISTSSFPSPHNSKTKLLKPTTDDDPIKPTSLSTKSKTKLIKPVSTSLKSKSNAITSDPLEVNSNSHSENKSSDLSKSHEDIELATEKIKKKKNKEGIEVDTSSTPTSKDKKQKNTIDNDNQIQNSNKKQNTRTPSQPNWIYNSDLVSEFADLPANFQKTIIPDLKRISSSSKTYFSKANKEITKGFKPYVGKKYAPTVATATSFAFIIIPFFLVSLLFNRIKAYFSLQRLLIFVQVYLSIYFSILCLSSLITGLEPLRFFYATSQSTYVWLQVLQTLGYTFYLLLLLMYLVLVFSTDTGPRLKLLGLAQTFLGFAVGLHYYMTVFHKMMLRQSPKTSWRVHAIYATCFLVICLIAGADGRKKSYSGEGGEEGKKS